VRSVKKRVLTDSPPHELEPIGLADGGLLVHALEMGAARSRPRPASKSCRSALQKRDHEVVHASRARGGAAISASALIGPTWSAMAFSTRCADVGPIPSVSSYKVFNFFNRLVSAAWIAS
jgi:hypothetical protein